MTYEQQVMSELKALGDRHKAFTEAQKQSFGALQRQVDCIDSTMQRGMGNTSSGGASYGDGLREFKSFLETNKGDLEKHGRLQFSVPTFLDGQTKSVVLSGGLTSVEPAQGVFGAGRFAFKLRSLFRSIPATQPTIGVLRSVVETLATSPQVEGSLKAESIITFLLTQVPIQVFASFLNVSKQSLDDLNSFTEFVNSTLLWSLEKKADSEILSGDSTGVHLTGIMTHAQAFDSSILPGGSDGWNKVDVLGAAATQLAEAGWNPDFVCLNPRDWYRMVSLKNSLGSYVLAAPTTAIGQRVYSLQVVQSPAMTAGSFVCGDSSKAVIRQRENAIVEVSFENGNNFTSNLATVRAEERFGLEIYRPDAFVSGPLTTSPA
jgi:HK97 family phage major capsid protein